MDPTVGFGKEAASSEETQSAAAKAPPY